jgi:uncharacterized membrane protein (UPF0136 family)
MQDLTRFYLFAYAALMVVGGIAGGSKGSVMSIMAGVLCGLLAGIGAFLMTNNAKLGLGLALGGAVLALGGMLPRFLKSHAIWPAGVVTIASAIALVLTIIALTKK